MRRQTLVVLILLLVLAAAGTVVVLVRVTAARTNESTLREHVTYKPDPVDTGKRY